MFRERALLVLQYVVDEDMKKVRYHEMLRSDIQQFVSRSSCKKLDDIIERDMEREIDLETETKRKSDQAQSSRGMGKRPKIFDSRSRGQQGGSRCGKCGGTHDGACKVGGSCCF